MKHDFTIGVLGGMGTYATIHLFQQYAEVFPATKEWERPRLLIDNRCTMPSRVRAYLYHEEVSRLVDEMTDSLQGLLRARCDKILLACNTSHLFLPEIFGRIPGLKEVLVHLEDVCVRAVTNDRIPEVFLLGTEGTMDSGMYQDALRESGIRCTGPEKDEYARLRACIEAVKQNAFSEEVRATFLELVNRHDACILGCTELPVLYEKYRDGVTCEKVYDPLLLSLYAIKDAFQAAKAESGTAPADGDFARAEKEGTPDVLRYNADAISAVAQLPRVHLASGTTADALTLLHFSDIHGDELCLRNIQTVKAALRSSIDDAICTGDFVRNNWSSDFGFWDRASDGSILTCIGNHDVILPEATDYAVQPPEAAIFRRYIGPYIGKWGGDVFHEGSNLYYYKDYPAKQFRLIVLNAMYPETEKVAEQNSWLAAVLADARAKNLAVVIAEHYYPDAAQRIDCTFSSLTRFPAGMTDARFQSRIRSCQTIVQDFMDCGGAFVCYLCGHRHADYIAYTDDYRGQLFIGVAGALCYSNVNLSEYEIGGDARRIPGEKSMDCFNVISFDRSAHYIKLVRFGCDRDLYMRHRGTLVLDYGTAPATVVYND